MPLSVIHRISIPAPQTHLVHVETTLLASLGSGHALPEAVVLFMPVWTPGSYLLREYARHVEGFAAEPPCHATKIRKNAWRVESREAARIDVRYRVYAGELTVRTNHVDDTHAFLVGAALFLCVEGHEKLGASVEITGSARVARGDVTGAGVAEPGGRRPPVRGAGLRHARRFAD